MWKIDETVTRYSQLSKLGRPESVPLADLRRWVSRDLSPGKFELGFLDDTGHGAGDLLSLVDGTSGKNWLYWLTERLSWRFPTLHGRSALDQQTGGSHVLTQGAANKA